jgi:hypothetical protein
MEVVMGNEPAMSARMALPVACTLRGNEATTRVATWKQLMDTALLDRERVGGGIRLTFRAESGVAETVARLIELEGECCAWMSFAVRDDDDLIVDIGADDAMGRQTLAEMFGVP